MMLMGNVVTGLTADEAFAKASTLEQQGKFKEAAVILDQALRDPKRTDSDREKVRFEIDRLERIHKDFANNKTQMFDELKTAVKDLTRPEFDGWVKEGRFDHREIDGETRFMSSSVANLFFRYPALEPRRVPARSTAILEKSLLETCRQIRSAAIEQKTPYVLPKRLHVTMTVTAKPNAAPVGQNISAWLPIPREYPFQNQFQLISSSPSALKIASPESPIRSIYLEQPAKAKQQTEFKLVYDYTASGVRFRLRQYVQTAAKATPTLTRKRVTPHLFRHTTAVHLVSAGVDVTVIRSWLGHAHLDTTNHYAQANLETKRKALEQVDAKLRPTKPPRWKQDADLMAWLDSL